MDAPSLSVDLEEYFSAIVPFYQWNRYRMDRVVPMTEVILAMLGQANVKATFYVLGHVAEKYPDLIRSIALEGHRLGSHGFYHRHNEREDDDSDRLAKHYLAQCGFSSTHLPYRSPYWDTTKRPGWSGGAFFRILPYGLVKRNVQRSGHLWLHPHDLDPQQPRIPGAPVRRYVGLDSAQSKLWKLLMEVGFGAPH